MGKIYDDKTESSTLYGIDNADAQIREVGWTEFEPEAVEALNLIDVAGMDYKLFGSERDTLYYNPDVYSNVGPQDIDPSGWNVPSDVPARGESKGDSVNFIQDEAFKENLRGYFTKRDSSHSELRGTGDREIEEDIVDAEERRKNMLMIGGGITAGVGLYGINRSAPDVGTWQKMRHPIKFLKSPIANYTPGTFDRDPTKSNKIIKGTSGNYQGFTKDEVKVLDATNKVNKSKIAVNTKIGNFKKKGSIDNKLHNASGRKFVWRQDGSLQYNNGEVIPKSQIQKHLKGQGVKVGYKFNGYSISSAKVVIKPNLVSSGKHSVSMNRLRYGSPGQPVMHGFHGVQGPDRGVISKGGPMDLPYGGGGGTHKKGTRFH